MMKKLIIIDYGMSNLRSVSKALEHVADAKQWQIEIGHAAYAIAQADKVVFPGQGAIGQCMQRLHDSGVYPVLLEAARSKPFLGICLGMQTLMTSSEESGGTAGFDLISGSVRRFPSDLPASGLKIPHMGWNQVQQTQDHPLWRGIDDNSRFYFVHSYYVQPSQAQHIAATTEYGVNYASAVAMDNIFAVQFHPEKSQHVGLKLLANFLAW
jgi:imidazole glycerol-phosphate synthase subunit HisH